jgi:uncharacterized Zn-binding protein involved in type VI secretion
MGQPIAKANDQVQATDTHIVMVPAGPSLAPSPLPHPFMGLLDSGLCNTVKVAGQPVATVDSVADNTPPHIPSPPGVSFQIPPKNQGTVMMGSQTVKIGGKAAARSGDPVQTCNDPSDLPVGSILAFGTVTVGG